jgi:sarcosine oxidase
MERFDVIIIGLGAMGSAAAYHLARRGQRVLGLDLFQPPHIHGSAHGQTRIIREAYFEHPIYVPLVQRAYELWAELERESGRTLFRQTGGLMVGPPGGEIYPGSLRSAREHHLPFESLTPGQIRARFPALRPDPDSAGLLEPRAGILFVESCVETHLQLAARHGAQLRFHEPASGWEAEPDRVRVKTKAGEYAASHLLCTAGAWTSRLFPELRLKLQVERQVQWWFQPARDRELFGPDRLPVYLWESAELGYFYGFPDLGNGAKIAFHHPGEVVDPDHVRHEIAPEELEAMRRILRRYLPAADGPLLSTAVCLYTRTPDNHFLIDSHPEHPQVLLASPCSGHGFKFASAIGETLADLVATGGSRFDLSLFRRSRFDGMD